MNNILWWIFVAHFVFDWGLQNRWMAENKSLYWEVLFAHCVIYTGGISFMLFLFKIDWFGWVIFVFLGHFIVDRWSSKKSKHQDIDVLKVLKIDHFLHFLQLGIILLFERGV